MSRSKVIHFTKDHAHELVFFLIFLTGILLRFLFLGIYPNGLNQDEASAGYEAWSLLHYGVDRSGCSWPVLFISWGSGQNVLYSYILMPFIALFGLSTTVIRLPAAILGCLSLLVIYNLGKTLWGSKAGLFAMGILAVNPWHIMISRWALESNILPFFLLLAVYLFIKSFEKAPLLLASAACFACCLYAYGTAFIFLPVFLIVSFIYVLISKKLKWYWILSAVALFFLLSFPVILCQVRNILGLESIKLGFLTLPQLTESRSAATSVFGGDTSYFENLWKALRILQEGDGIDFNSLPGFAVLYPFGLLLAIIGLGLLIFSKQFKEKRAPLLLIWLFAGLPVLGLIEGNVNRINFIILPLIILQVPLLLFAYEHKKLMILPFAALFIIYSILFTRSYIMESTDFTYFEDESLSEALDQAEGLDTERILVTNDINMPYIYILFYEQIPPEEFYTQVTYYNPGADFQWVYSFGKWNFGDDPQTGDCYVYKTADGFAATTQ